MLDFKLIRYLAAAFTPDLNNFSSLKVANEVTRLMGQYVGDEPTILPTQQDLPPDVPRIIFSQPGNRWSLNISTSRTNLFYQQKPFETNPDMPEKEFSTIASVFFSEFGNVISSQIQRVAFVSERLSVQDDALNYIQNKFCNVDQLQKGRAFSGPKSFEIHSLKTYPWEGFDINSWVRIKAQNIKAPEGEVKTAIVAINDLNTLSMDEAPEQKLSPDDVKRFFENISDELCKIVALYFD